MLYVLGFAFSGDCVLLIRKSRPRWQAGSLNGIGGKVEAGEAPVAAMCREFSEECGVETSPDSWREVAWVAGGPAWQIHVFTMTANLTDTARTMTDEPVEFVALGDLLRRNDLISNVPWLVAACLDLDLAGRPLEIRYPTARGF